MRRLLLQLLLLLFVLPSFGQIFQQKVTGETAGLNGRYQADDLGHSVSISEDVMVVGAPRQRFNGVGVDSLFYSGAAYIYHKVGGSWQFVKKVTGESSGTNGRAENDFFGWSVSVSGDVVVVGAYYQDYDSVGGDYINDAGAAYIFHRNKGGQDNWGFVKKLTGTSAGANGRTSSNNFGFSVSIKEDIIAIGAIYQNYDSAGAYGGASGAVYLFYRDKGGQNNWGFVKKLTGASAGYHGVGDVDQFGYSVCVTKDILVVGADFHAYDSAGGNYIKGAGAVYVFYRNAGGQDNWGFVKKLTGSSAGKYGRTSDNLLGNSVALSGDILIAAVVGHNYDSIGENTLYSSGAVYIYERNRGGQNNWGFVKKLTGASAGYNGRRGGDKFGYSVSAYKGEIAIGAQEQDYNSIGSYFVDGAGAAYIFAAYFQKTRSVSACKKYINPQGKIYTSSGTYIDTLTNTSGVDSIIITNLTINQPTTSTISPSVCNSYISPQGKLYIVSGTYYDTLVNSLGCDSILVINLTINQLSTSAISPVACVDYTSPQGKTYTMSGTYYDTLVNTYGCDSIITINLTIYNGVDKTVTQQGLLLMANDTNATNFQWFDCANNLAIISGQTNRAFTGVHNGSYAVEINIANVCIDTSDCITIKNIGIKPTLKQSVTISPNPTTEAITTIFSQPIENAVVRIVSINGQIVITRENVEGNQAKFDLTVIPSGVYFIEVVENDKITRTKMMKL